VKRLTVPSRRWRRDSAKQVSKWEVTATTCTPPLNHHIGPQVGMPNFRIALLLYALVDVNAARPASSRASLFSSSCSAPGSFCFTDRACCSHACTRGWLFGTCAAPPPPPSPFPPPPPPPYCSALSHSVAVDTGPTHAIRRQVRQHHLPRPAWPGDGTTRWQMPQPEVLVLPLSRPRLLQHHSRLDSVQLRRSGWCAGPADAVNLFHAVPQITVRSRAALDAVPLIRTTSRAIRTFLRKASMTLTCTCARTHPWRRLSTAACPPSAASLLACVALL